MNELENGNWNTIAQSPYAWEREALDYVKNQFPSHEPYRAWSNFEFIADDGSLNEVDLLVFGPEGFFLVEIKSRPGIIKGDAHTWIWQHEGRTKTIDNPLFLANLKAKKLASLLQRQRAFEKFRVPFIDPLIFCSADNVQLQLQDNARFHVCLRDTSDRPGIMAAIKRRACLGLSAQPRGVFDRPMGKAVSRALEQIGIRPSQRSRRVGDYELQEPIEQGPGYQDFVGKHVALKNTFRRIRLYLVRSENSPESRAMVQRAAEREYRLLQTLEHRGVLRALEFTNHELGPAIFFQHFPDAVRLDHYLMQRKDQITDDLRLGLMRQIAETISFAHDKHIVHRNLSPRAVLLVNPENEMPRTVLTNWQLGYRQISEDTTVSTQQVTATMHVDELADETTKVFMAPESLQDGDSLGEHHDIFSLGAVCYQLFTGRPPAESTTTLAEQLRIQRGLIVSAVKNGVPQSLDDLVKESTDPDVSARMDTAIDFIEGLNQVEDELTTPTKEVVLDPILARPGDMLPGGYEVIRKLGTGSTATAILVAKDGREFVTKIAVDADHNGRVRDEGEVLQKFNNNYIIHCHAIIEMAGRTALLLDPAGDTRSGEPLTLGKRLRMEGRLSLDLLQRFGEDLLEAVVVLEAAGIPHRDIKPENIGTARWGRDGAMHLVLFDFSLSRCSPENIRAGTPGYVDPFLPLRKPPRWDLQAERFSAAITLYQMATGFLPVWHDGKTDPSMVDSEVTIDGERFNPDLREKFTVFFRRALRRSPRDRFDNAQQMLEAWQEIFETATATVIAATTDEGEPDNSAMLVAATVETNVAELGLGAAAVDALDRINVVNVGELLHIWGHRLARMRGVGNKTRKRILRTVKILRARLGSNTPVDVASNSADDYTDDGHIPRDQFSIDVLVQRIFRVKAKSRNATDTTALEVLLGMDERLNLTWPSQAEVAPLAGVTRARISQILNDAQSRWLKDPAITALRDQIASLLEANGGVMSAGELCEALLTARGSVEEEPRRSRSARVVTRVAVETENLREEPKYVLRRAGNNAMIAVDLSLADYAAELGQRADQLAAEDPLIPPARVLEMLRDVTLPPEADPLADARLIRLAAAASETGAVSSKQEIYPRNMDAGRAIKLSYGGLLGVRILTPEHIRQRVTSRYPLSAVLPGRPAMDRLLADAGLELEWRSEHPGGGAYVSTVRNVLSVTDASSTLHRQSTLKSGGTPTPHFSPSYVGPEVAEARAFEERLRHAEKRGSFLALTAKPSLYELARIELSKRFFTRPLDLEEVFLVALRHAAEEAGADWNVVVSADAADTKSENWRNLNHLIASKVIPQVEQAIISGDKTVLAFHLNWLARYGQVEIFSRIAQAVQDGRVHGAWLLIPASPQTQLPLLDGTAVPVITSNQWAYVPESWCENLHRAEPNGNGVGSSGTTNGPDVRNGNVA